MTMPAIAPLVRLSGCPTLFVCDVDMVRPSLELDAVELFVGVGSVNARPVDRGKSVEDDSIDQIDSTVPVDERCGRGGKLES